MWWKKMKNSKTRAEKPEIHKSSEPNSKNPEIQWQNVTGPEIHAFRNPVAVNSQGVSEPPNNWKPVKRQ